MPKKALGQETEVAPVETPAEEIVTEAPQAESIAPTTEKQMDSLKTELAELKQKYEKAQKGLMTASDTMAEKDRLLKSKEDLRGEIDDLKYMIKIVANAQGSRVPDDDLETIPPEKKPDINKAFDELEQKQKARRTQEEFNKKADDVYSRAEAVYGEDEDSLFTIRNYIRSGDFDLAERKVSKAEKEKTPVENKPADDRDKKIADLEAKLERLEKIQSGELDTETGISTGSPDNIPTSIDDFRVWVGKYPDKYREKKEKADEMLKKGLIK